MKRLNFYLFPFCVRPDSFGRQVKWFTSNWSNGTFIDGKTLCALQTFTVNNTAQHYYNISSKKLYACTKDYSEMQKQLLFQSVTFSDNFATYGGPSVVNWWGRQKFVKVDDVKKIGLIVKKYRNEIKEIAEIYDKPTMKKFNNRYIKCLCDTIVQQNLFYLSSRQLFKHDEFTKNIPKLIVVFPKYMYDELHSIPLLNKILLDCSTNYETEETFEIKIL